MSDGGVRAVGPRRRGWKPGRFRSADDVDRPWLPARIYFVHPTTIMRGHLLLVLIFGMLPGRVLPAQAAPGHAASSVPYVDAQVAPRDAAPPDTAHFQTARRDVTPTDTTAGPVVRARIDDEPITPVTVRYLGRVFEEAAERGAAAVLIELDTPGGLVQSTREIVTSFLGSPIPVIVYVSPSGARAASAGVFITVAAHVAAMAPGTHIGAAHPVQMGPGQADTTGSGVMEEKILNDTRAWARSLANLRGRNADWVEAAVTRSESVTAAEALELDVVDLVAEDAAAVLERIDGQAVEIGNRTVLLRTADAEVVSIDTWWGERLLGAIANPNVAFILLMLGFYGLLFEFYSPGWGVAGTVGALCLLLGFTGMSILPINLVGLLLILAGLALFVAEAFVPSFGVLTIGGVAAVILGGLMLVDSPVGVVAISTEVLVPVAVATGAIAFFLMGQVVRAHRKPTRTGAENMIGTVAVVAEDFAGEPGGGAGGAAEQDGGEMVPGARAEMEPGAGGEMARRDTDRGSDVAYTGLVRTHGELWRARSDQPLLKGERARITSREGLTLRVSREA